MAPACIIAGKIDDVKAPAGRVPIFYLPGISRQYLRAVEGCPEYLRPTGGQIIPIAKPRTS